MAIVSKLSKEKKHAVSAGMKPSFFECNSVKGPRSNSVGSGTNIGHLSRLLDLTPTDIFNKYCNHHGIKADEVFSRGTYLPHAEHPIPLQKVALEGTAPSEVIPYKKKRRICK